MASCSISNFLLLRQNKVAKEEATPVCRPGGIPCATWRRAGEEKLELKTKKTGGQEVANPLQSFASVCFRHFAVVCVSW